MCALFTSAFLRIPNNNSSVDGEILELYVVLNHSITFCVKTLVKEQ